MRNEQHTVEQRTHRLLQGPLKHIRGAALAAALLPLASVAATPAVAQDFCSGGAQIGDFVWFDENNNGIQDSGEQVIAGAVVSIIHVGSLVTIPPTGTDTSGMYQFFDLCPGQYQVLVQIPPGMTPSPANQGGNPALDSNGTPDGLGNSVAMVTLPEDGSSDFTIDFGFWQPPVQQPGTGTPGYWKNHPEAWPVETITIGGATYTKDQAIAVLWGTGSDKTLTMFSSLVSAKLNVIVGNEDSCVASTITAADDWMATYGPAGSKVKASSLAWKIGEPLHRLMDNYNNGMLCAPHRE